MGQVFINGQWVDDGKDGYFQAATGLRVGSQGVGSVATGYQTPPGLPATPASPDALPDVMAGREARYQASRTAAQELQAIQARNAQSDMPPGSPTSYLGGNGQVVGTVQQDEFGIPKPAPAAAVGLRGYPTTDEINAGIARDAAQAKEDQFNTDINSVMGRYPAAPKFQMPTQQDLIDPLIERQRNAEANAVANLNERLKGESDQPLQYGKRIVPGAAAGTRAELAMRSRNLAQLDQAQQANISGRSRLALEAAKRNDLASQDTARAQVVDLFSNIDESRYPHGSPERDRFLGTVLGQRPDLVHAIVKDKFLGKFVQDHMETHKTVGETMQALKDQYGQQGENLRFTPTITAKGDVSYHSSLAPTAEEKNKATLAKSLSKETGMTPEQFAKIDPNQVKAGGIFVPETGHTPDKPKGTFHDTNAGFYSSGVPKGEFTNDTKLIMPGYKEGKTIPTKEQKDAAEKRIREGAAIQIDIGKGKQNPVIPRARYNQYLSVFGNQQTPVKTGGKVMSVEDWLNQ